MASNETITDLNSLLRGEISAAETYKKAIDKIGHDHGQQSQVQTLKEIQREHGLAAQRIRERITALGGEADNDSGAWGTWANTVQGTANLLGDAAALKALKEGEEHGLKSYERKLEQGSLDPQSEAIARQMIPAQQRHIQTLDRLMSSH